MPLLARFPLPEFSPRAGFVILVLGVMGLAAMLFAEPLLAVWDRFWAWFGRRR